MPNTSVNYTGEQWHVLVHTASFHPSPNYVMTFHLNHMTRTLVECSPNLPQEIPL